MSIIEFTCPQCGNESFKALTEPKCIEDFTGAICSSCDRPLSEDDIIANARQIATDKVKDIFKSLKI